MAHPNPAELPGPDASRQPTAEELRSPEILLVPEGEKKVVDSVWLRGSDKVYVSGPTSIDITVGTERQKMRVFETEEQLWEFVMREGFVFDHIRGGRPASSQVIDLTSARERKDQTETSQQEQLENGSSIMLGIYEEMKQLIERCADVQEKVEALRTQMGDTTIKGPAGRRQRVSGRLMKISVEVNEKIAEAAKLSEEDDAELIHLADGQLHIDQVLIEKKRERRDQLSEIVAALETLLAQAASDVQVFIEAAKDKGPTIEEPKIEEPKSEAPQKEEKEKSGKKVAKSGPGGPKRPEGPGLDAVLTALQTKFTDLIEPVKTPGEYAALRNGMTPADEGGKRYFLDREDIKRKMKVKDLTSEQLARIATVEKTLEDAARGRFFEIKNDVLKDLSRRWRAELNGASDATALDALALKWSEEEEEEEEEVLASWKEVFASLSPKDQKFVTTDYTKRFAEFQAELKEKRAALAQTHHDTVRRQELEATLNIADPVKAREKVMFLEGLVIDRYHEYVKYMQIEAKKIKPNGVISAEECWSLWQKEGGEAGLEEAVIKYLRVFHGVDAEAGKKAFLILVNSIKQGA